ncbi:MAG: Nif3-like dinuclear metal center hexameric protein [Saprospiraceae bacterium]
MKIKDILAHLESIAPPSYQENYDNAGLITGSREWEVKGALCCLDTTEEVIDEAIQKGCNLVVAHHPIVFKGLKRLNGNNYVERTVIKAIRHEVAIYAIHTNLDNMLYRGVNSKIAERLGIVNTRVLAPKTALKKLAVLVPASETEQVRAALFSAGAGTINGFDRLSYAGLGVLTQGGSATAHLKLEVVFPGGNQGAVLGALHKVAPSAHFEITSLENSSLDIGAGLIGELPKPARELDFLKKVKKEMKAGCVRHTQLTGRPIKTVALCGGAGSFLLPQAIRQKADVYITGDFKYHEFFDAEGKLVIADIGHFESEQFTIDLLQEIILEKFPTFAPLKTEVNTNPVLYL